MLDNIFGIHGQTLLLRAARAQVLASNLANAETPGYKARDLNVEAAFADVLQQQAGTMTKTHAGHFTGNSDNGAGQQLQYRTQIQASLDGNTVDMERERSAFMQNTLMYQASLQFINGRIRSLMTAIRGE